MHYVWVFICAVWSKFAIENCEEAARDPPLSPVKYQWETLEKQVKSTCDPSFPLQAGALVEVVVAAPPDSRGIVRVSVDPTGRRQS